MARTVSLGFLMAWGVSSAQAFCTASSKRLSTTSTFTRARPALLYLDDSNRAQVGEAQRATVWSRTPNGLSFKELTRGAGERPEDAVVTIKYTATLVSTGTIIEDRALTFPLRAERFALFGEASAGMAVGGTRLVNLPPSSRRYAIKEDEDISFEIELVRVETGVGAALVRARANPVLPLVWRTLLVLSFAPDILNLLGVPPLGTSDVAADGTSIVASAATSAGPAISAANQWAVQGLQATGLL